MSVCFSLSNLLGFHSSYLYILPPKTWGHNMFLFLYFLNLFFLSCISTVSQNTEVDPKPFFCLDTLSRHALSRSLHPSWVNWDSKSIFLPLCKTEHLRRDNFQIFLLRYLSAFCPILSSCSQCLTPSDFCVLTFSHTPRQYFHSFYLVSLDFLFHIAPKINF